MGTFESLSLMRSDLSPGDQQQYAHECLRAVVSRSNLHYWEPGDRIADEGTRVLIGIGVYVPGDLRLLDRLDQLVGSQRKYAGHRVDIFSVFDIHDGSQFEAYFPGIGTVREVPIAGLWKGGRLQEEAWGPSGREILVRAFPELATRV